MAPPDDVSIKSTPSSFSCWVSFTESFMSQPPSAQSDADRRTKSGVVSGIAWRIALVASSKKRVRFSKLPPYSSVRWFISGEKNWWKR